MWIDVSVPLDGNPPAWPGSPGVSLTYRQSFEQGDGTRDTQLTMDVHCGTHIETSAHVRADGAPIGNDDPSRLMGRVVVLDGTGHRQVPAQLAQQVPEDVVGVLVRTDNSERRLLEAADFDPHFVGWSTEFATAIADMRGIRLAGSDYLSIQPFKGDALVHACLLDAGITVVEGLNLAHVIAGLYEMVCLELLMPSREAAPARVILRPISESEMSVTT